MGFAQVTAILIAVMIGGTLPAPLYVIYSRALSLSSGQVTILFACYVVGALVTLLCAGHLSDHHGRRPIMLGAIIAGAIADLVFILFDQAYLGLIVARLISGTSIGLISGAATASLSELTDNKPRASKVAGASTMLGIGLGALIAGPFAQWIAHPTVIVYLVHLALLLAAAAALATVPEPITSRTPARLRLPHLHVPARAVTTFIAGSAAGFCAFALFGIFSSLAGTFLVVALHNTNLMLSATVTFSVNAVALITSLALSRARTETLINTGLIGLFVALAAIALSIHDDSLPVFLVSVALSGATGGCAFQGGLQRVLHATDDPTERAGLLSAFYVVGYAGMAIPVLGAGFMNDALGITTSITIFTAIIAALAALALLVSLRSHDRAAHPQANQNA